MDKTKGHYHFGRHHAFGALQSHHYQAPGKREETDENRSNHSGCLENGRYGTLSFQANNSMDIFQVLEVRREERDMSDEELIKVKDMQFESHHPWITGNVPQLIPVYVDGDTVLIHALFKGDSFDKRYTLRIYVEYEEQEILIQESTEEQEKNNCALEPQEIHL